MSSLSNFQKLKELGKGSFSTVYKVCRKSDNKEYAMKVVKITQLSEKERQNALNEIRILASIVDPNIIAYKEAFFDENIRCLCIIMEYADGGDLLQKLTAKKNQKAFFSETQMWKFLIQMTKGLRTLHNLKILHRDLKCANIFQMNDQMVKLGDLNVSKITQKGLAITQAGTPYYCAPEVWKGNVYDKKCDIWSLGCVMYELAALKPPFQGAGMKDLFNRISKGEFERIPKCFSNELFDVIKHCLRLNPNERPNCDEILNSPVIRDKFPEEMIREKFFSKAQLLNTIKMPKNMKGLMEKLPKPNYQLNNKSFDGEEEERNVRKRCPSESGIKEKNYDPKDKMDLKRIANRNNMEEKERPYYEEKVQNARNNIPIEMKNNNKIAPTPICNNKAYFEKELNPTPNNRIYLEKQINPSPLHNNKIYVEKQMNPSPMYNNKVYVEKQINPSPLYNNKVYVEKQIIPTPSSNSNRAYQEKLINPTPSSNNINNRDYQEKQKTPNHSKNSENRAYQEKQINPPPSSNNNRGYQEKQMNNPTSNNNNRAYFEKQMNPSPLYNNNKVSLEKPPIKKNPSQLALEKQEKPYGIIKYNNKVEQPLKQQLMELPKNFERPASRPEIKKKVENGVKIERPMSKQEIKKQFEDNSKNYERPVSRQEIKKHPNFAGENQVSNNKQIQLRPSSSQDQRKMKEKERNFEKAPSKNVGVIKRKEVNDINIKMIPKTPVIPSNKENVNAKRYPGLEIKNKRKY